MGRQISFYWDETTQLLFDEKILSENNIYVGTDKIRNIANMEINKYRNLYIYKDCFGKITMNETDQGKYYIDSISSPVIEYTMSNINHEKRTISCGRLWVGLSYWNDNRVLVSKSIELERCYDELKKWIRKNTKRVCISGHIENVSPAAIELARDGYILGGGGRLTE